jgi:hypothetical protein
MGVAMWAPGLVSMFRGAGLALLSQTLDIGRLPSCSDTPHSPGKEQEAFRRIPHANAGATVACAENR